MKLYEFEGKSLFAKVGIPIPKGAVAASPAEAAAAAQRTGYPVVLKSQVLRGGRGKAGGIRFAADAGALDREARALLSLAIGGERVERLLVEERLNVAAELYAGITLDPLTLLPQLLVSPAGGVEIEAASATAPERLQRLSLDPLDLPSPAAILALVRAAGVGEAAAPAVAVLVAKLVAAYFKFEAVTAEINPLIVDTKGVAIAADAKFEIDDSALWRVPEAAAFARPEKLLDPLEAEAKAAGIAYVPLGKGNVGLVSGGAGLGMASMDMILLHGGAPANFLDLGGNATKERTAAALRIVLATAGVEGVLLNLFGGINNCESMAQGIAQVLDERRPSQAIVVKMRGHSQTEGWAILEERQVPLVRHGTTEEAVLRLMDELKRRGAGANGDPR